jgi:hypothetical protein
VSILVFIFNLVITYIFKSVNFEALQKCGKISFQQTDNFCKIQLTIQS